MRGVIIGLLFTISLSALSFDEEIFVKEWEALKGTNEESAYLINFFLSNTISSRYSSKIKRRLKSIVSDTDIRALLNDFISDQLTFNKNTIYTLVELIVEPEHTTLLSEYYHKSDDLILKERMFRLLTMQDNIAAFSETIKIIGIMSKNNTEQEVVSYINYMLNFKNPDLKNIVIKYGSSSNVFIRASSFMALRNYHGSDIDNHVNEFIAKENKKKLGKYRIINKNSIIRLLNKIKENNPNKNSSGFNTEDKINKITSHKKDISFITSDSGLAIKYAPVLYLSDPGFLNLGVDMKSQDYPYTDYIPTDVYAITSNSEKLPHYILKISVDNIEVGRYLLDGEGLSIIGAPGLNNANNYVDFEPIWNSYDTIEDAYKKLTNTPAVYYKVFHNDNRCNPTAIQYWFFYFYNDWFTDHPGDWETITVFLDADGEAIESIYSTHYEANSYSWNNIRVVNQTHPIVYVSNGGHGSYNHSGNTKYSLTPNNYLGVTDNHLGNKERIYYPGSGVTNSYKLINLTLVENNIRSWIWFNGRWGNESSAPKGPHLRTDIPTSLDSSFAKNPPKNPYNQCSARGLSTRIYGNNANMVNQDENYGPWFWASGYGIDGESCIAIDESCTSTIGLNNRESGQLQSRCKAFHRNDHYAKYYSFELQQETQVVIDLESDAADTYLYLLNGPEQICKIIEEDDDDGTSTNSRITRTLAAGKYTVEATSYNSKQTGDFAVSVNTGSGIHIKLFWQTEYADLDLYLIGPNSSQCYWGRTSTSWGCVYNYDSWGGRRDADPYPYEEHATVELSDILQNPGNYQIEVKYYDSHFGVENPSSVDFQVQFLEGINQSAISSTINPGDGIVIWEGDIN